MDTISSLVEYQADSIVSKTIIDKDSGTVTLFAFARGQSLSEHTVPFEAVVIIIEGEAIITIDKKEYVIKQGEMSILPVNIPHSVKAVQNFKMLLIMLR